MLAVPAVALSAQRQHFNNLQKSLIDVVMLILSLFSNEETEDHGSAPCTSPTTNRKYLEEALLMKRLMLQSSASENQTTFNLGPLNEAMALVSNPQGYPEKALSGTEQLYMVLGNEALRRRDADAGSWKVQGSGDLDGHG
ncbi:hypothetical protein MG293_001802 [Ovis ammon polii]|uniref:Uncharacterized protein n=1 Tax=Ovis ammon polii TaxID=230172 RepID=A0AAD4UQQ3_OVIAM|nr:hypothetical protein MG293_001802 [Ovis ammon polii]